MDKTPVKCKKDYRPFDDYSFTKGVVYVSEPDWEGIVIYDDDDNEYYPDIVEILTYFEIA